MTETTPNPTGEDSDSSKPLSPVPRPGNTRKLAGMWRVFRPVLYLAVVGLFAYAVWDAARPVAKVHAVAAVPWSDGALRAGLPGAAPLPEPAQGLIVSVDKPIEIRSVVDGAVAEVMVKQGDRVRSGQQLLRLDDSIWQLALVDYKALRSASENGEEDREQEREEPFFAGPRTNTGAGATSSTLLTLLHSMCSHCRVVSPVDGIVERIGVAEGEKVRASAVSGGAGMSPALVVIRPSGQMAFEASMTPEEAWRIGLGRKALVCLDGMPEACDGIVSSLNGSLDRGGQRIDVRIRMNRPRSSLEPGMKGRVEFCESDEDRELRSLVLVPRDALTEQDGDNAFIWVIGADNLLKKRRASLHPSRDMGARAAVRGILPGEPVVLFPDSSLREGQRVSSE